MASPDPAAQKTHRGTTPRNFSEEEILFVLDRAKTHTIKDITALINEHSNRTFKVGQVKYIRDAYGKDPSWGPPRNVAKRVLGHSHPSQGTQGLVGAQSEPWDSGNGTHQSPSMKSEHANTQFGTFPDQAGPRAQEECPASQASLKTQHLLSSSYSFAQRNAASQSLGRSGSMQAPAMTDSLTPAPPPAPRDKAVDNGYSLPAGQAVTPAFLNPWAAPAAEQVHTTPGYHVMSPRMPTHGSGQIPVREPAPFDHNPMNVTNRPVPSSSISAPSPLQAVSPLTIDPRLSFSAPGPEPANTGEATTSALTAVTGAHTAAANPTQPVDQMNIDDFLFDWRQPEPDLSSNIHHHHPQPQLQAQPIIPHDFSASLAGPGTWHEGTHDDCPLDAQHRHCPDGGVYFTSAAGAERMIAGAAAVSASASASASRDAAAAVDLAEIIRAHTERMREFQAAFDARASVGIVQGTGQAVMLLDIGEDLFAPAAAAGGARDGPVG